MIKTVPKGNILWGTILALSHIICFIYTYFYINVFKAGTAQIQLVWIYWLFIDFPISLLVLLFFFLDNTSHYMLYFVHGILGTIWWFYVPSIFLGITDFFTKVKAK